jgi:hypothetical protein
MSPFKIRENWLKYDVTLPVGWNRVRIQETAVDLWLYGKGAAAPSDIRDENHLFVYSRANVSSYKLVQQQKSRRRRTRLGWNGWGSYCDLTYTQERETCLSSGISPLRLRCTGNFAVQTMRREEKHFRMKGTFHDGSGDPITLGN